MADTEQIRERLRAEANPDPPNAICRSFYVWDADPKHAEEWADELAAAINTFARRIQSERTSHHVMAGLLGLAGWRRVRG